VDVDKTTRGRETPLIYKKDVLILKPVVL